MTNTHDGMAKFSNGVLAENQSPRALQLVMILGALVFGLACTMKSNATGALVERHDGYVDSNGLMIYYESIGMGPPLLVLHGGPGLSHEYFLPYFLQLATQRRLIFIDERGSGRSARLNEAGGYTLDGMVSDVEAVRVALHLGNVDLLGHSFGGILAQAYAIKHPDVLRRLILASTASSATRINADFATVKDAANKTLRKRIELIEAQGILDASGAQKPEYRKLADEAELPYNYHGEPPSWDSAGGSVGWEVYTEMWGAKTDFHIDGNLKDFDFTPALRQLTVPTLIIYGDHDLLGRLTAEETHSALEKSQVVELQGAAHMTFVDQPTSFFRALNAFLQ